MSQNTVLVLKHVKWHWAPTWAGQWHYTAVMLVLLCGKCPGFYGAVFCGMVQLGPTTCRLKWGESNILLISPGAFPNVWNVSIVCTGFCTDMRSLLDPVIRAASRANIARVSPRLSRWVLCDRSTRQTTCWLFWRGFPPFPGVREFWAGIVPDSPSQACICLIECQVCTTSILIRCWSMTE